MAQEHTTQQANEARDEPAISPVESNNVASSSRETAAQPTASSSQPQSSVDDEVAPPLPKRPTRSAANTNPHPQGAYPQPLPQPYHQQQMPYAPYPYPPQTYQQPGRVLPPMTQRYIATKLGLTVLSSIIGIIIIALSSIFISERGEAEYTAYYTLPIVVAAIIWNTAELITYCVRLRKETQRGIHPGAHVALHLLFWLACAFAVLVTSVVYRVTRSQLEYCTEDQDDDPYYRYGSSYRSSYCDDYYSETYYRWTYLPTLRALVAMLCLATVNHFALFVLACMDTHRRNLLKPAGVVMPQMPPAMYYGPPPPPGMVPMQYYPLPMQMPPQQQQQHMQQAHFATAAAPGAPTPAQNARGQEAVQPNYQSLAGFYAPAPAPPAASRSSTPRQGQQHSPVPAEAGSSSNEKAPAQTAGQA